MTDAELYRIWQAQQLMREAGYVPDADGNWHPAPEED